MSDDLKNPDPTEEPSVLDYVKSLFRFGNGERIRIPVEEARLTTEIVEEKRALTVDTPTLQPVEEVEPELSFVEAPAADVQPISEEPEKRPFPWRSGLALIVALLAQRAFEPPHTATGFGIVMYVAALSLVGWALYHGEWKLAPLAPTSTGTDSLTYHLLPLIAALILGIWAFTILGDNLFTRLNVTVWVLATLLLISAFWLNKRDLRSLIRNSAASFQRLHWTFDITPWTLLVIAATVLIFFFRFYHTPTVPPEPFSDHAEKLLDVYDVSQGITHIFFPRNTGREAIQMYWTLLIAKVFGSGLSFLSLKIGTAILGFLTLPFIYYLGKEIGGPRVGFLSFVMVGIGYWPNLISRVGLRFPLYPLFAAPTLLFLIRGFRRRDRNDFILSGLFLGAGLHGYSPMRIMPFVAVAAFAIYWLHAQSKGARKELPVWLTILGLVSLFVFLPLLRYWYDEPGVFSFRAFTRLSNVEQPLPGPAYQIFLSNLWHGLRMFNYDDGEIWVNSVVHRPALDLITAALFLIGVLLILVRYIRQRHWLDLFLLVSIPLLLMPSILSLAFPGENPALNRGGGGYIPAMIIAALALDGFLTSFGRGGMRTALVAIIAIVLFYFSAAQNFDLVFHQYYNSFRQGAWNSSDMGRVIKDFEATYGPTDNVWVVPFPYWVDTRLPAVWAGIPNRDLALWPQNLTSTLPLPEPKLFIVKANTEDPNGNDQESLDILKIMYANGQLRLFHSDIPGHDFWIFTVPKSN